MKLLKWEAAIKLVIFPGLGNPSTAAYEKEFQIIRDGAREYYSSCEDLLRWPGHCSETTLTLNGALGVAKKKLAEMDENEEPYHIVARSFGCFVALKVAIDCKFKRLARIILWGPVPYWFMWKRFVRDFQEYEAKYLNEVGIALDSAFFSSLEPIETMLPQTKVPVVVATGMEDRVSPPAYHIYLKSLASTSALSLIQFKEPVEGAPHRLWDAPPRVISAYLKALFE